MKRLLNMAMMMTVLGGLFLPMQGVSAQSSGPDICAAARNGESVRGYDVVWGRGGSGNQVVLGTDDGDLLRGGSGNDVLCGFDGDDDLRGGTGNDILVGGEGDDTLRGGSGNNTLIQDGATSGDNGGGNTTVCSDDGWENLAPADDPTSPFGDEDECLDYLENVGDPVAYNPDAPHIQIIVGQDGFQDLCALVIALNNFPPNTTFTVKVERSSGDEVLNSPFSITTGGTGAVLEETGVSLITSTYTASTTVNGETVSDTRQLTC